MIETALADAQSRKAAWTRADLTRSINAALPDYLGLPDGADVGELLDQLTDEGLTLAVPLDAARPGDELLPDALRLANGKSAYQSSGAQLYCTPEHVRSERLLLAAARAHSDTTSHAAALPAETAQRFLDGLRAEGVELGADQAAAVRGILTSGAAVATLVGPAGTGKSFVVGTLTRAWTDRALRGVEAGRVFGLATSQVATDVLIGEGLTARNVDRWLATQDRLAAGPGLGQPQPIGGDEAWRLRAGDMVVVDESAMTDTPALAAIHRHVDAAGARLLLVGDHRQLAAVGAGGGMDLLAQAGASHELVDARRFTHAWEREASLRLREGDETVLRDYHRQGRLFDAGTVEQAETSAAAAWLGDTLAGHRSLLLVDTNEQAARLSAQLRAELVRLGHIEETGVPLGLQGTVAGVGDLVQARHNAWDLAGHEGNRRGPINRETYRVTAVRDDGSIEVQTVDGASAGERRVLPAGYVAEHLALGYASTVHAAQGLTVDTCHTVATPRSWLAGLYVSLTRGRDVNTAHVATTTTVDDPARGGEAHRVHRDPVAVLADVLDRPEPVETRSAIAIATESVHDAEEVRTPAELLADAAHIAATERTAGWLDQLTFDGHLTFAERTRVAAEDGTASLTRILRRAELSGLDPRTVLHVAVAERPLDRARNVTNVLYRRIADQHHFDPVGQSWADWVPQVDNPEWQRYLASLAQAADARARELGRDVAEQAPGWAIETLGPAPTDGLARGEWEQRAAAVAAYRELAGHDDPANGEAADALGPAPQPGQVEAYAAYRAAWRALGRPEIDREETELSDGQLRMRVRAWEREKPWSPRYVGNELAGTRQAAAHQHRVAALRDAEATAAAVGGEGAAEARLAREAADAAALARTLDGRADELQVLDDARAQWLAHTAMTRAKADRSAAMLAERHAADIDPEPVVTAAEWLAAHRAADAAEEQHRGVTEADLASEGDDATRSTDGPTHDHVAEAGAIDLREVAETEPAQVAEDVVRVPTAADVTAGRAQADRAVAEIRARTAEDDHLDEQDRTDQLARWHHQDQAADIDTDELTDGEDVQDGDVLSRD